MKERTLNACDHIGIFTNNSKRLVDFYMRNLGFKFTKKEILDKSIVKKIFDVSDDCQFIRLVSDKVMIEIFEPLSIRARSTTMNIIGYNHWGYCVSNRLRLVQALKRKKVKIIEVKRNAHIVYFIKDPDGNRIEIR